MKSIRLIVLFFAAAMMLPASAQDSTQVDKKWKFSGKPGVKWSRNTFSNWAAGGIGSSAIEFDSEAHAHYAFEDVVWNNDLEMSYGFNRRNGEGKRKIVDKFNFNSKFSWVGESESFRYSVLFNAKSQFTDGYDYRSTNTWYLKSGLMAPGYFKVNVGVEYIGIKRLNVHFSPIAEKTTIVSKSYYEKKVENVYYRGDASQIEGSGVEEGGYYEPNGEDELPYFNTEEEAEVYLDSTEVTYGLAWRETSRFETGAAFRIMYDYPGILKNVDFKTRFDVFSSYSNFGTPDIDWEVWLTLKFNDYIAFNINTQMIYDSDILSDDGTAKVQFRDFFGVGLTYTFQNK